MKITSAELDQQLAAFIANGGQVKQESESKKKVKFYTQYNPSESSQVLEFVRVNAEPVTITNIVDYLDMPKTKVRTILEDLQTMEVLTSSVCTRHKCRYWQLK